MGLVITFSNFILITYTYGRYPLGNAAFNLGRLKVVTGFSAVNFGICQKGLTKIVKSDIAFLR